mmetsp:Transcript_41329/g.104745  ORF Transcript_41329/g.104745 Transcript_41329/m.104745 type:complete len:319 (+) Transcript_41329:337-1293(+)
MITGGGDHAAGAPMEIRSDRYVHVVIRTQQRNPDGSDSAEGVPHLHLLLRPTSAAGSRPAGEYASDRLYDVDAVWGPESGEVDVFCRSGQQVDSYVEYGSTDKTAFTRTEKTDVDAGRDVATSPGTPTRTSVERRPRRATDPDTSSKDEVERLRLRLQQQLAEGDAEVEGSLQDSASELHASRVKVAAGAGSLQLMQKGGKTDLPQVILCDSSQRAGHVRWGLLLRKSLVPVSILAAGMLGITAMVHSSRGRGPVEAPVSAQIQQSDTTPCHTSDKSIKPVAVKRRTFEDCAFGGKGCVFGVPDPTGMSPEERALARF